MGGTLLTVHGSGLIGVSVTTAMLATSMVMSVANVASLTSVRRAGRALMPVGLEDDLPLLGVPPVLAGLHQALRPPQQTATQHAVTAERLHNTTVQSHAARHTLLAHIEAQRSRLAPSLAHLTADELLDRYAWEFARLPLHHNAYGSVREYVHNQKHNQKLTSTGSAERL